MKRILSIDGGGIRGIIPARVLARIEAETGRAVSELFDLVAGTSTGGIIALGLSRPKDDGTPAFKAEDMDLLYQKRGQEIFYRSAFKRVESLGGMTDEKYSASSLEDVLLTFFEDTPMSEALMKVLVTSYDIQNRTPYFFKSWRDEWGAVPMRSAARATSAAPTYFEPALVEVGDAVHALVDGGVFINNPTVSAYAEALRLFPDEEEHLVVSLGTGQHIRPIPYDKAKDWGKVGWALPILDCMFDGVSDAADYQMKLLLGDRFVRLQASLDKASDDLDNVHPSNIHRLMRQADRLIEANDEKITKLCRILVQ